MKSKFFKKPEIEEVEDEEIEQDEDFDDVEVDEGGPSIASAKKNKVTIIAASSLLITVVLYFFFFKSYDPPPPVIKPIALPSVTPGESPFEIEPPEEQVESTEPLDTPETPTLPKVPDIPDSFVPEPPIAPPVVPTLPVDPNQPTVDSVPPFVGGPTQGGGTPTTTTTTTPTATTAKDPESDPRYAPIIVFSGGGETTSPGVGYDENIINLNEDPIGSLQKSAVTVTATYVADRVHAINQGKLLNAVLETAINTEIPGSVRAIVSRDVYGESGNEVLITRGSRLYGSYSSNIVRGQGRVNIFWTRLIRSDGVDLAIQFNASDQFGRAGIPGETDNKYGSIITSSLLTSILTVGGVAAAQELLGDNANTTATTNAGVTTTTGNASAQAVADVSQAIVGTVEDIISNSLNLTPVITIPQGTKITVVVNADMNIPSLSAQ